MELIEVAPGIDIERDILAHMDFKPDREQPAADGPADLQAGTDGAGAAAARLEPRRAHHLRPNAQHAVRQFRGVPGPTTEPTSTSSAARSRRAARRSASKVALVANYDGFYLDPMVSDAYFSMITYLQNRYYSSGVALHDERVHATEARRRTCRTQPRAACVRDLGRGTGFQRRPVAPLIAVGAFQILPHEHHCTVEDWRLDVFRLHDRAKNGRAKRRP